MQQKNLLSPSKILVILLALFFVAPAMAQRKKPDGFAKEFLKTQWWLGLRFGSNVVSPIVLESFSTFSPVNYEAEDLEKTYGGLFSQPGLQAGLDVTFYHKGFMVGLQPSYKRLRYNYINDLRWEGPNAAFITEYEANQSIDILEIPMTVKYEVYGSGKARPFVMAGGVYSIIMAAQKEVNITQIDESVGVTPQETRFEPVILGVREQFRNFLGLVGGVGVSLDYWNIRTVVEISYLKGMSDITRDKERFTQNELTSLGDVNDELILDQFNLSLSFVFPLRYIDKQFQAY